MADTINIPTFEQIETILTKLATNYSNLAILFYDIFYNTTPMDVTFQMYDESGVLQTYTIPNRAKDKANILSGSGSPQGNVDAGKGVIYQDLENGDLYIKITAVGTPTGWTKFVTENVLREIILEGIGSPENIVVADKGTLYIDRANAGLYMKALSEGNTGWVLISANTETLADRDLSNLTSTGENHFAKPNFSNITVEAQQMFDEKENVSNKVTSISSTSTDDKFPSAKAVYDFVGTSTEDFADKDFSNITTEAEARFLGNNKLSNCILEATTIMYRGADNSFILPAGTKLLCTIGLASNNTFNNEIVDVFQDVAGVIPTLTSPEGLKGFIFYEYTGDSTGLIRAPEEARYFVQEEEPTVVAGGVWFNPVTYTYHSTKEVDGSLVWVLATIAEVGKWETNPNGSVKTFTPYYPVRMVTSESEELAHVVVKTGGTDENWYRLYKDGWIEAGGCGYGNTEIAFFKNFRNTNYTFVASGVTSYAKAAGGVTITASGDFDWIAKGWVA
jgi:hypothetical protein